MTTELIHGRSTSGSARANRGSVLLLVIATLMLIMLIGISYMRVAQDDRAASAILGTGQATQQQLDAVISQIQRELERDFPIAALTSSPTPTTPNDQEAYDYPGDQDIWLASTAPEPITLTGGGAGGGAVNFGWRKITRINKDYHTRAGSPNINGKTSTDAELYRNMLARDMRIVRDDIRGGRKTGGELEDLLSIADADGDDISDSRWERAPLESTGGREYKVAIRVMDLSALLNINVALSASDASGNSTSELYEPRFRNPTDFDLGYFVGGFPFTFNGTTYTRATAPYQPYMEELATMQAYRLGKATAGASAELALPWIDRNHFWRNAATVYGGYNLIGEGYFNLNKQEAEKASGGGRKLSTAEINRPVYRSWTEADELKLRHRGGLNRSDEVAGFEREAARANNAGGKSGPSNLFRNGGGLPAEYRYEDVRLPSGAAPGGNKIASYYGINPRAYMTTFSGAMELSRIPGGAGGQPSFLTKQDINQLVKSPQKLYEAINDTIKNNYNPPQTIRTLYPTAQDFAAQLAANIVDYVDSDSDNMDNDELTSLTAVTGGNGTYYGMEALPYISRVVVQDLYKITKLTKATAPTEKDKEEWQNQDTPAFAFELRNPHRRPITLKNMGIVIGTPGGAQTRYKLEEQGAPIKLEPDAVIVLYTQVGGNSLDALISGQKVQMRTEIETGSWPASGQFAKDENTSGAETFNTIYMGVGVRRTTGAGGGAGGAAGDFVVYQKVEAPKRAKDNDKFEVEKPMGAGQPTGTSGYRSAVTVGSGIRVNMMTYKWQANSAKIKRPHETASPAMPDGPNLGDKLTRQGFDFLPEDGAQLLFSNTGTMTHIGDLAQIAVIGPREASAGATKAVNEILNEGGVTVNSENLFNDLYLYRQMKEDQGTMDAGLPVALRLFERFTTFSPANDGNDNDGDGRTDVKIDGEEVAPGVDPSRMDIDGGEYLVVGRQNINTVPNVVMQSWAFGSPQLAAAIEKYRANETTAAGGLKARPDGSWRKEKGFESIGEVLKAIDQARGATAGGPGGGLSQGFLGYDGVDNNLMQPAGQGRGYDFLNNPNSPVGDLDRFGGKGGEDGIKDDVEEKAMILRWLSQMCTTRSDTYVAYILLRGDLPATPNETGADRDKREEAGHVIRAIVVFDRSGLYVGPSGTVRGEVKILGKYIY